MPIYIGVFTLRIVSVLVAAIDLRVTLLLARQVRMRRGLEWVVADTLSSMCRGYATFTSGVQGRTSAEHNCVIALSDAMSVDILKAVTVVVMTMLILRLFVCEVTRKTYGEFGRFHPAGFQLLGTPVGVITPLPPPLGKKICHIIFWCLCDVK